MESGDVDFRIESAPDQDARLLGDQHTPKRVEWGYRATCAECGTQRICSDLAECPLVCIHCAPAAWAHLSAGERGWYSCGFGCAPDPGRMAIHDGVTYRHMGGHAGNWRREEPEQRHYQSERNIIADIKPKRVAMNVNPMDAASVVKRLDSPEWHEAIEKGFKDFQSIVVKLPTEAEREAKRATERMLDAARSRSRRIMAGEALTEDDHVTALSICHSCCREFAYVRVGVCLPGVRRCFDCAPLPEVPQLSRNPAHVMARIIGIPLDDPSVAEAAAYLDEPVPLADGPFPAPRGWDRLLGWPGLVCRCLTP